MNNPQDCSYKDVLNQHRTEPDVREIPDPVEGQQAIDQTGRLCVYRSGHWYLMENISL